MDQLLNVQELPDRAAVDLETANAFKLADKLVDGEILLLAPRGEPRRVLTAKGDLGIRGFTEISTRSGRSD